MAFETVQRLDDFDSSVAASTCLHKRRLLCPHILTGQTFLILDLTTSLYGLRRWSHYLQTVTDIFRKPSWVNPWATHRQTGTVAECCRLGESCLRVIIGYCKSLGVGSANFNTKSARYCWKLPFMFMQSVRIRLNWVITAVRRR